MASSIICGGLLTKMARLLMCIFKQSVMGWQLSGFSGVYCDHMAENPGRSLQINYAAMAWRIVS